LFPRLAERTRLFRLFNEQRHHTQHLIATTSLIGLIDTYGIELIYPRREGCSERQVGRKGQSNRRWIVGGKLCAASSAQRSSSKVCARTREHVFEFAESVFNGRKIGRIGRQKQEV